MSINSTKARPSVEEVRELVDQLEDAAKLSSRGKATKRVCDLFDSKKKAVSWKFQEWDYGKNNINLPCNARGLFILEDEHNPQIIARGYDKFFNIDETPTTKWDWIENNTVGPYEVTLKSNGCIIFISGLEDGTIVVCSKHSTGPRADVDRNHAESGKRYLLRQLEDHGVDQEAFARRLYELNITAVAEYCDDTFEEHILEYTGDQAGLYLHGINANQRNFVTWPMEEVAHLASEYGFKPTNYLKKDHVKSLRMFLKECSQRGSYDNQEIEGFVIRCHLKDNKADYFFKYKFEEPYLMYRQWREVTKDYINTKSRIFKFRKHKFITNKYLDFVIPLLNEDPVLCEQYIKGFGIIKLRNMFLEEYGMSGMEILNYEKVKELELRNAVDFDKVDMHTKFLIFPVAVIGCGKTTTSLTLKNVYPDSWAVVQNDDITSKDKSMLMKKSLELLAKPEIRCVVVDRNNHQYRERKQLFDWLADLKEDYMPYDTNIKVIGLSFFPYEEMQTVKDLTISRVMARGNNHQSIKSGLYGEKKVLGIMQGFMNRFQAINEDKSPDNLFDFIINLRVSDTDSSLNNATEILRKIHDKYPTLVPVLPSDEKIEEAFRRSLAYVPTVVKTVKGKGHSDNMSKDALTGRQLKLKKVKPVYFAADVRNSSEIIEQIYKVINNPELEGKDISSLEKLFSENRVQPDFHVTLCHVMQGKKGTEKQKAIWNNFNSRYRQLISSLEGHDKKLAKIKTGDVLTFRITKLCWDSRIVSIIVDLPEECVVDQNGEVVPHIGSCNKVSHITIGILKEGVAPYYSNELCEKISKGDSTDGQTFINFGNTGAFEADISINF